MRRLGAFADCVFDTALTGALGRRFKDDRNDNSPGHSQASCRAPPVYFFPSFPYLSIVILGMLKLLIPELNDLGLASRMWCSLEVMLGLEVGRGVRKLIFR